MIKQLMEARDKEEGFTLIELLVVIIIIGILAAIAIPVFLNQRNKGFDSAVRSDLRNSATAQETWLTDNTGYTKNVADLETVLGYRPKVTVEEGVRRFVEWYLAYYGDGEPAS